MGIFLLRNKRSLYNLFMSSQIASYLSKVSQSLVSGHATEHSYRPELRDLFVALTKYNVINEPKGSEHGKPDFIFLSGQ